MIAVVHCAVSRYLSQDRPQHLWPRQPTVLLIVKLVNSIAQLYHNIYLVIYTDSI